MERTVREPTPEYAMPLPTSSVQFYLLRKVPEDIGGKNKGRGLHLQSKVECSLLLGVDIPEWLLL